MSKILIFVLPLVFINSSISEVLDLRGNSVSIPENTVLTQDRETGIIYGSGGRSFILTGEFESFDDETAKPFMEKCGNTLYFSDPAVVPDTAPGTLPGAECNLQQISGDSLDQLSMAAPRSAIVPICEKFTGVALPLVWSPPVRTVSHIGPATFKITVKTFASTQVSSWARYWNVGAPRWNDARFIGSVTIQVGNAASSIWMSYFGDPFGTPVETTIC
jgi:hypothetical protein